MENNQSKSGNELDLVELFSAIWRGIYSFFKGLIDVLLFLLVFGIRRYYWMALFIILGAITGYVISQLSDKYYSSEMIAQPNGFTSVDMAIYINDIHEMCIENNWAGIARSFEISEESAQQIKNIEAFHLIDMNDDDIGDHVDFDNTFDPKDTTTSIVLNRILIRAEVLNNSGFTEVKEGLIRYINSNPYLIAVNDIRKRELQSLIDQSEAEISKLDSLQDIEYYYENMGKAGVSQEGQIVFLNEKVTQLYYQDKVSLLTQQLIYSRTLELATNPITIIKDFAELQNEENPTSGYIINYGIIFIFLGYILILIITYRDQITRFFATKAK